MKKKVLASLLVSTMAISMLAGCGSTNNNSQASQKPAASQGTESDDKAKEDAIQNLISATTGTVNIDLWCSEKEEYQKAMAEIVENFKKTYSTVDFNIVIGAVSEGDAKDRVLEDAEAAADVFVFAGDQLEALNKAGALQEVVTTYTYDPAKANGQTIVDAASIDGKLLAYPLTASNGYFLFYDKNTFTDADVASWEALVKAAEEKNVKVGMDIGNSWYLWGFFAGAGLVTTHNADDTTSCEWNNATGLAVANKVQELVSSKNFVSTGNQNAIAMLDELKAFVDGTWDTGAFEKAYADGYAAVKLPTFNVDGKDYQTASFAGYKFVGVNSFAENKGWSMLLAEFITSEASQLIIGQQTGEGPANTNAASQITSPALSALGSQAAFAYTESATVGGNYWTPASALGAAMVEGNISDMQKTLDETVAGITQAVQK